MKPIDVRITKTAQISENSGTIESIPIFIGITVYSMKSL